MLIHFKIALKNIFRNKRKNFFIALIFFITTLSFVLGSAMLGGMQNGINKLLINGLAGHLQICSHKHPHNCLAYGELTKEGAVQESDIVLDIISKNNIRNIESITRRTIFGAAIYKDESFIPIKIIGVEPDHEREINSLLKVTSGSYLSNADLDSIILNKSMADKLELKLGDSVDLISGSPDGDITAKTFYVKGTIEVKGIDMYTGDYGYIPISTSQEFLLIGDKITAIVIKLKNTSATNEVKQKLQEILKANNINLRVDAWYDIGGIFNNLINLIKTLHYLGNSILFVVIIIGILNSLLLAIFERTKEVGTLAALGTTEFQILKLFIFEILIIAVFATSLGAYAGVSFSNIITQSGIQSPDETISMIWGGGTLYPSTNLKDIITIFIIMITISIIGTLYPAILAARKSPVDALRYI
ncbi:MAG: ABC transporter permease [Candidatus Hodarchaeota archaeon]